MKIDQFQHGSVQLYVPHGPITEDEVPAVQDRLAETTGAPRIVLSMREVPYLDSKGLEMLLEANDAFHQSGGRLRLAEVDECCREILYLTGHLDDFEIHGSIDDAVRSLL